MQVRPTLFFIMYVISCRSPFSYILSRWHSSLSSLSFSPISLPLPHFHSLTLPPPPPHTHARTHTHTRTHSHTRTHTHVRAFSLSLSLSHTHSLPFSHTRSDFLPFPPGCHRSSDRRSRSECRSRLPNDVIQCQYHGQRGWVHVKLCYPGNICHGNRCRRHSRLISCRFSSGCHSWREIRREKRRYLRFCKKLQWGFKSFSGISADGFSAENLFILACQKAAHQTFSDFLKQGVCGLKLTFFCLYFQAL